jgi:hypothetical protein
MEVHFPPAIQEKPDRLAAQNGRGPDEYVQQLVENYLDHDAWFRGKVKASLERLDQSESVDESALAARIERILKP